MSLTVSELREALRLLSLDTRGNKQTLKQRLAKHQRSRSNSPSPTSASSSNPPPPPRSRPPGQVYDSYLVFDVEATCERIEGLPRLAFAYPNEIIEWPVILLQWRKRRRQAETESDEEGEEGYEWKLEQVDEFHSYVKPIWKPQLSSFCTELTGITQADINDAPTFPRLLRMFESTFIRTHELFTPENKTCWVTDGPWDLRDFVAKTCYLSTVRRPDWLAGEIVDLKLVASHFFSNLKTGRTPSPPVSPSSADTSPEPDAPLPPIIAPAPSEPESISPRPLQTADDEIPEYLPSHLLRPPPNLSIPSLLSALTLPPFSGRLHSGLSDARNLSRILVDLAQNRQVVVVANRVVPDGGKGGKERRWGWMKRGGEVKWEEMKRYEERRLGREKEMGT